MTNSPKLEHPERLVGTVNYLDPSVAPSVFRNGKVLTRRNADGSDSGSEGVVTTARSIALRDGRRPGAPPSTPTIDEHGFALVTAPVGRQPDYYQHDEVVRGGYYDECAQLVADATGARFVAAFDHNVRSAAGKAAGRRVTGGQEVQGPAHMVHGDYTLTSARQRLADLASPPTGNDTLRTVLAPGASLIPRALADEALNGGARFAIINVWRNIADGPVMTHPLALCAGRSVVPADLVVFEIHYADRVGENYFARPASPVLDRADVARSDHEWFTYPGMQPTEALLIKQWDCAGRLAQTGGREGDDSSAPCTFSFHTAYQQDVPAEEELPARESVEVRCVVVY